MKCANCQMVNQTPETPCSHCGRMLPAPKPNFISKDPDDERESEEGSESGEGGAEGAEGGEAENGAGEGSEAGADAADAAGGDAADAGGEGSDPVADPEGELAPEDGHVDNVGDETETETVT